MRKGKGEEDITSQETGVLQLVSKVSHAQPATMFASAIFEAVNIGIPTDLLPRIVLTSGKARNVPRSLGGRTINTGDFDQRFHQRGIEKFRCSVSNFSFIRGQVCVPRKWAAV